MKGEGSDSFAFIVATVPDVCPILREGHEIKHSADDFTPEFRPYLFGKSGVCPMCAHFGTAELSDLHLPVFSSSSSA